MKFIRARYSFIDDSNCTLVFMMRTCIWSKEISWPKKSVNPYLGVNIFTLVC
jgi:hypothetical protein